MQKEYITQMDVNQYELLYPLLVATYEEIQKLSNKKPESPLNNYKVKAINRILIPLKEILSDENVYEYLDILDTDDLPTNSDVVLILSQFIEALAMFKNKYYKYNSKKALTEWSVEQSSMPSPSKKK